MIRGGRLVLLAALLVAPGAATADTIYPLNRRLQLSRR